MILSMSDIEIIKEIRSNSELFNSCVTAVDKEVYDYYKDSSLKEYSIRYIDDIKLNNSFLLKNDNKVNDKINISSKNFTVYKFIRN